MPSRDRAYLNAGSRGSRHTGVSDKACATGVYVAAGRTVKASATGVYGLHTIAGCTTSTCIPGTTGEYGVYVNTVVYGRSRFFA